MWLLRVRSSVGCICVRQVAARQGLEHGVGCLVLMRCRALVDRHNMSVLSASMQVLSAWTNANLWVRRRGDEGERGEGDGEKVEEEKERA
eukprot:3439925-Rhodomonas_salina.6